MKKKIIDPNITFRKKDLKKAADLIKLGESFNVIGMVGVGKSRFLRHLAYKKSFLENFEEKVLIVYCDIRKIENKLRDELNKELVEKVNENSDSLEKSVQQIANSYDKIYLILDETMLLTNFDTDEINKIRALRDTYKYKLNFVFAYNKKTELSYELDSLLGVAQYTITLNPLEKSDMVDTIIYIANSYEIPLKSKEIEDIANKAMGYPGKARNIILNKILGETHELKKLNLDHTKILEEALLYLTKNEYLALKAILEKPNYFLEKDEIALTISPKSKGIGVSDAAISQLIKRLRDKLKKNRTNIEIKTKRGFGYYIE